MKIAIDGRITYNNDGTLRVFTNAFWQHMALSLPEHDFIFITAQKKALANLPGNVHMQYLRKLPIRWMDNKRVKRIFIQSQADKLITLQHACFTIGTNYKNKTDTKNVVQPDKYVLFAGSAKPTIKAAFSATILIRPALADVITSLTWAETESIKTQYTGGRAFFLFVGNISDQHQLIELLKAFSLFKKWQQSGMQLVIAGYNTAWTDLLEEKLLLYKYKTDVVILKNISHTETAKLVAASYAMLYPVNGYVFPIALLWAVQGNKAIIATDNEWNRQITSAAAWVEGNNTAEGFANAMILLYKDENQLQLLVQQTKEVAVQFNRNQMLAAAWQCIMQ